MKRTHSEEEESAPPRKRFVRSESNVGFVNTLIGQHKDLFGSEYYFGLYWLCQAANTLASDGSETKSILGVTLEGAEEAQEEFWIPNETLLVIFKELPRITLDKMKLVCK